MRWIRKDQDYPLIEDFRSQADTAPETFTYENFRPKLELARILAEEQRGLCAYTMRGIIGDDGALNAHIEHIVSRDQCKSEGTPERTLDFRNIVACFPSPNQRTECSYGARRKGGTSVTLGQNFVSPLQADCESRFLFQFDGTVTAQPQDLAAHQTIEILNLNDLHKDGTPGKLAELRQAAIEGYGLSPHAPQQAELHELSKLEQSLSEDADRYLPEYVVALRQCLQNYRTFLGGAGTL